MNKTTQIKAELEAIRAKHGGILQEEAVVRAAKNQQSIMHSYFIWDDSEAAARYRLIQAQELIVRMTVRIVGADAAPSRMYVSLTSDRHKGGGYRYVVDVLSDKARLAQLLADALAELDAFTRKYKQIKELKPIFLVAGKLARKIAPPRRKRAA